MAQKFKWQFVIEGDSSKGNLALKKTRVETEKLSGAQKRSIDINKQAAAAYGKVSGQLSRYAAIGGGIALAASAAMVRSQLEQIDVLAKTSDKLGIATEDLVGLRHAADLTGVAQNNLDISLQRMTRRLADAANGAGPAAKSIKDLGLNAAELAKLAPDKAFGLIADAMNKVESQSEKVRLSFSLFDSEGVGLVNTLKLGSDGLAEIARQTEIAGTAISRLDAARIEAANDAIATAKLQSKGFAQQLTILVAPALTDIANRLFNVAEESDGVGSAAQKAFDFVIKSAGVMANGIHGVQVVVKGLEAAFAGVATVAVKGFGLIVEGYSNLASAIPGIDINYEETAFGRLEKTTADNFKKTMEELNALALEEIPSEKLEKYIEEVTRRSTELAEQVVEAAGDMSDGVGDLEESTYQLTDAESKLVENLEHELTMLRLTGAEREFANRTRGMSAEAIAAQGAEIRNLIALIQLEKSASAESAAELKRTTDIRENQIENIQKGLGDTIEGFIEKGEFDLKGFYDFMLDGWISTIAQMAAASATQSLFPGGSRSAGGTAASGSSAVGLLSAGSSIVGAGSNASFMAASLLQKLGLQGLSDSAANQGVDLAMGGTKGSLANMGLSVLGGVAGNFAGSALGEGIFGKTAESSIGGTVGGTAGGIIGGPLGAFIGSTLGSMMDAAFGGDGKKRNNAGFLTSPIADSSNSFSVNQFESGYQPVGFANRADQGLAKAIIDEFRAVDAAFTRITREMGINVDLQGANLNGLDQTAATGSSGLFFGLGGSNGLTGDISGQLSNFLGQLIDQVSGQLPAEVTAALGEAGNDVESILLALTTGLEESIAATEASVAAIEAETRAEEKLAETRADATRDIQEQISEWKKLGDQAAALQGQIRSDMFRTMGISELSPAGGGSFSDQIGQLDIARQLLLTQHSAQIQFEQALHDDRMRHYQEQLSVSKQISRSISGLLTGSLSPLSGKQKFDFAQSEFNRIAGLAESGDIGAAGQVGAAGETFIGAIRQQYASGAQSKILSNQVIDRLTGIQGKFGGGSAPAAFNPAAANDRLIAGLTGLDLQLEEIKNAIAVDSLAELRKLNEAVGGLQFEVSNTAALNLPQAVADMSADMIANGASSTLVADKIAESPTLTVAANTYLAENNLGTVSDFTSARNTAISDAEIMALAQTALASGGTELDQIKHFVAAAAAAGVGSAQAAKAIGLSQSKVTQLARDAGYPEFAEGAIVTSPTIGLIGEGGRNEGIFPLDNQGRANAFGTEQIVSAVMGLKDVVTNLAEIQIADASQSMSDRAEQSELLRQSVRHLEDLTPAVGGQNF